MCHPWHISRRRQHGPTPWSEVGTSPVRVLLTKTCQGCRWRLASVARSSGPKASAGGQETGYGLGWDLETVTLAGEPTLAVGHDGESLGGMVMSFMTFRERGLVVAVMSNTTHADTRALALNVAGAFAERAGRQ
jgi:CubicO group peptidase (beta-lactamase class C family)